MPARQPGIDPRDDSVPVAQQVEGDHRRDHQERDQIDQRHPAADHLAQELGHPAHQPLRGARERALDLLQHGRVDPRLDDREQPGELAAQGLDVIGQPLEQTHHLPGQDRHQQQEGRQRQDQERRRQPGRGERPGQAPAFEPVADRVEQVGDRHAGHEGQQHATQQEQRGQEHRQPNQPEPQMSLDGHGARAPCPRPCPRPRRLIGPAPSAPPWHPTCRRRQRPKRRW